MHANLSSTSPLEMELLSPTPAREPTASTWEPPALLEELERHPSAVVRKGIVLLPARGIVGVITIVISLSQLCGESVGAKRAWSANRRT